MRAPIGTNTVLVICDLGFKFSANLKKLAIKEYLLAHHVATMHQLQACRMFFAWIVYRYRNSKLPRYTG